MSWLSTDDYSEGVLHNDAHHQRVLWWCFPLAPPPLCVAGSVEVSRRSPVASWLCAMLYCFGSYILADVMLGGSPIDYFQHNSHILLASAVWWEKKRDWIMSIVVDLNAFSKKKLHKFQRCIMIHISFNSITARSYTKDVIRLQCRVQCCSTEDISEDIFLLFCYRS